MAAEFSEDNQWYRAVVREVLPQQWVKVFFVDFGNEEERPYFKLKKLPESLVHMETYVRDLHPTTDGNWVIVMVYVVLCCSRSSVRWPTCSQSERTGARTRSDASLQSTRSRSYASSCKHLLTASSTARRQWRCSVRRRIALCASTSSSL